MAVDLGSAVYGDTPSATVLFDGADELNEVKSDYGYFDAAINSMRVTITPKAGLQPGTYTDTLYVHTENGAVHFITVTLTVTPKPEEPQQEADAALSGALAAITVRTPSPTFPAVRIITPLSVGPLKTASPPARTRSTSRRTPPAPAARS